MTRAVEEGASAPIGSAPHRWWLRSPVWWTALLLWAAITLPLAMGWRTLCLRDVFATHLHTKAFGAAELAAGRIPAFRPDWGLGQVFRGNPNTLSFYPGNLLYLVLPFWSAFNLHYTLHWLLAGWGMGCLGRRLGLAPPAALLAAITWAGSGWMLSALTFYNLLTVAAWWPWVLCGGVMGGRRGIALGGLACGMALLGGEPVTALLGLLPLLLLCVEERGFGRGAAVASAIGAVGSLVALPQLVASLRVIGFTFRGAHGLLPTRPGTYVLHPARLLELLLPYPFGFPADLGAWGFWAHEVSSRIPWVLTLHAGVVALWLAPWGLRRRPLWGALAAAGLLAAWAGGRFPALLHQLSGGLFRYPEKLLFWFALALPLLAGAGLERVCRERRGPSRWALGGGLALAATAFLLVLFGDRSLAWARARWTALEPTETAAAQTVLWLGGLLFSALILLLAGWLVRQRPATLPAAQLLALLPLLPLVVTDSTAHYRRAPEWAGAVPVESGVLPGTFDSPFRDPPAPYRPAGSSIPARLRLAAADLDPSPGTLFGLSYPLAPDLEGMHTPLAELLLVNLPRLPWSARLRWLRTTGTGAAVLPRDPRQEGIELVAERWAAGARVGLYRIDRVAPRVWWPQHLRPAASPTAALLQVGATRDPVARVAVSEPAVHHPGATAEVLVWEPDRVAVTVRGEGGVLIVRRAYHPLWQARDQDGPLRTVAANLWLLGVVVPPGTRQLRLEVGSGPELAALLAALAAATTALAVGWRR